MTPSPSGRAVATYFLLAFAISWVAVGIVILPGTVPASPDQAERLFPLVYLAMLAGPPVAGVATTAWIGGRTGLRAFGARLLHWRVPARWYAVALLTAPLVLLATVALLSRWSPDFAPALLRGDTDPVGPAKAASPAALVLLAVGVGLGAGFFEELGWTGFATPAVRTRHGASRTGVLLGTLWGAWHLLAVWWGSASAFGTVRVPLFLLAALFAFLPPYRLLMVRVYDRTASLPVAVLMHASLTTSMLLFGPVVAGERAVAYNLAFGAALWLVVALTGGRR